MAWPPRHSSLWWQQVIGFDHEPSWWRRVLLYLGGVR